MDRDKPLFCMMIGLSGSGKSYCADLLNKKYGMVVHSSDALRLELYGDENCQDHNEELFNELHKRIKDDLKAGKNVCYDATNIKKKRRIAFLKELKGIACDKCAILVIPPYEQCIINNARRERVVPPYVIERQYHNFQPPHYNEGFDDVCIIQSITNKTTEDNVKEIHELFNTMCNFNQENSHHTLTLGEHCFKAAKYIDENAERVNEKADFQILRVAAMLHDIGKLHTKTRINAKGENDGDCHYYQHHCVGAYDSFKYYSAYPDNVRLELAQYIYYHMHPYMSWEQSESAKKKDMNLLGEEVFNNIMLLHEADVYAH